MPIFLNSSVLQDGRVPGSQSPLSKAVNTEFSRRQQQSSSKLGDGRPANLPFLKKSKSNKQVRRFLVL